MMEFNKRLFNKHVSNADGRCFQREITLLAVKTMMMVFIVLTSFTVLSLRAQAAPPLLVDEQDLLTSEQEADLLEKLEKVSDTLDTDVIIYIPQSLNGQDVAQFSYDYVAMNTFGRGDTLSAVVLVICRDGNYIDYSIAGTGTAEDKLFGNDDKAGDIEVEVLERLREYKENGFSGDGIYRACLRYVEGVEHDMQGFFSRLIGVIKTHNVWLVLLSLIVGFILSAIYMRIQRGKLISIRSKTTANDYIDGGVQLSISRDHFINQTVSRTKIEKESSSGGGSSVSRGSSGGRSFSSHSGRV